MDNGQLDSLFYRKSIKPPRYLCKYSSELKQKPKEAGVNVLPPSVIMLLHH